VILNAKIAKGKIVAQAAEEIEIWRKTACAQIWGHLMILFLSFVKVDIRLKKKVSGQNNIYFDINLPGNFFLHDLYIQNYHYIILYILFEIKI